MQDKAITLIGKIQAAKQADKKPYQLYIEDMFPTTANYNMALIIFQVDNVDEQFVVRYKGIDFEVGNKDNFLKFGYRKGSPNGGDVTFTTKLQDADKKVNTIANTQLKKLVERAGASKHTEEHRLFMALQQCFETSLPEIKTTLKEAYDGLSKESQKTTGLSVAFETNGLRRYLTDFEIIKEILLASGSIDKSKKYGVESEGSNQMCSICFEIKSTLHGFGSPFKYATVDKRGMVSGFFSQANNWKNYPICTECALEFELGKTFVTNELRGSFYGRSYYMIPKTILSSDSELLEKAIKMLRNHKFKSESEGNYIKRAEERFGERIASERNYFTLNLLFYEENPTTKAIKIKLLLEEILPSRFRTIYVDVPSSVNSNTLYKKAIYTKKKERLDLHFSFGILKTFFEEDFYDLIQKVFLGQAIPSELLFSKFMREARDSYLNSSTAYLTILKAFLTLEYFQKLGISSFNEKYNFMASEHVESDQKKSSFDLQKLTAFIEENKSFFDSDYKVGIFSVGILVRLLLDIQSRSLNNTPFEKKLRGYQLDAALLKSTYTEALSKISQYLGYYAYGNLRDFIDQYFILTSHQLNKISNSEISFYFVAGLEFGNKFKTTKDQDNSKNN